MKRNEAVNLSGAKNRPLSRGEHDGVAGIGGQVRCLLNWVEGIADGGRSQTPSFDDELENAREWYKLELQASRKIALIVLWYC